MFTSETTQSLEDLRMMLRIRRFEEEVRALRMSGDVVGSVHLGIGQEAIPTGVVGEADLDRDVVIATYRGHGWAIACGSSLESLFAEIAGRAGGVNGGRGGSAYLSDPDHGFLGENSIVGAGAPIAVGAALAARYDHSGRVAIAVFGDGALNQGAVHEALNFAAVLAAPVVFVVENNGYSEMTPIAEMVRIERLVDRAGAYGIPAERLDGNDVLAVRDATGAAIERARTGGGPVLLELVTERLVGHYIGDAEQYRRPGELEEALRREPIVRLKASLLASGAREDALSAIEEEIATEVVAARDQALAGPLSDPVGAKEFLYAK